MDGPLGGKIKKISIVKGGKNACTRSRIRIVFNDNLRVRGQEPEKKKKQRNPAYLYS